MVQVCFADIPLATGRHTANHFRIRIRAQRSIDPSITQRIEKQLQQIADPSYMLPNVFGVQRFGK